MRLTQNSLLLWGLTHTKQSATATVVASMTSLRDRKRWQNWFYKDSDNHQTSGLDKGREISVSIVSEGRKQNVQSINADVIEQILHMSIHSSVCVQSYTCTSSQPLFEWHVEFWRSKQRQSCDTYSLYCLFFVSDLLHAYIKMCLISRLYSDMISSAPLHCPHWYLIETRFLCSGQTTEHRSSHLHTFK